jgi:hypothetical protein
MTGWPVLLAYVTGAGMVAAVLFSAVRLLTHLGYLERPSQRCWPPAAQRPGDE